MTTLEANRDEGYKAVSKAPMPIIRYEQFKNLDYHRKVVTIEPVLDFDLDIFTDWIKELNPEYVWIGYNSRPKQVKLSEPSEEKLLQFIAELNLSGIKIRRKDLRGISSIEKTTQPARGIG